MSRKLLRGAVPIMVLFQGLIFTESIPAGQAIHTFSDNSKEVAIDDDGGYTSRYRFLYDFTGQFGEGGLIVWDGSMAHDPWANLVGNEDPEGDWTGSGSGIMNIPANGNFGLADEVTGSQNNPYMPVFFSSGPIMIYQTTYTRNSGDYVLFEWTVINTGPDTIQIPKVLFLIDWDLDGSVDDELTGWDSSRSLAYQQDGPSNNDNDYTTGGVALVDGVLDDYHLGNCCDFRDNVGGAHAEYFIGLGWSGDVDIDTDKEVGVSAELPPLAPGEMTTVVFVEVIAQGTSSANAIANLQAQVDDARLLWESIAPQGNGFLINAGLNDAWFNAATAGQGFFITVFPVIQQMFVAWFTYDTERPAGNVSANLGEPGHRWLTAFGPYEGDTAVLDIEVTSGGVFNMGQPMPTQENDGTLTVEFAGCTGGIVGYDIPSLALAGEIPIERIALDNVDECQDMQGNGAAQ